MLHDAPPRGIRRLSSLAEPIGAPPHYLIERIVRSI